MPGISVTIQLTVNVGKLDRILFAAAYLCQRLQAITLYKRNKGYSNIFPSIAEIKTTHFMVFDVSFKPCIVVAHEYVRQSAKNANLGNDIEFEIKFACDYLNDMFYEFDMPEVSATQAPLGDIIVEPYDLDVLQSNGGLPVNFGQGRLANATESANYFNGFNYTFVGANPVSTQVTYGNNLYLLQVAADNVAYGRGAISYLYTDSCGNFIAGPDGTASAPNANGFGTGQGNPKVTVANYVRAADLLGLKMTDQNYFHVDNNEISVYHSSYGVNLRERMMTKGICRNQFDRLIGQEVPYDYVKEKAVHMASNVPGLNPTAAVTDVHREYTKVARGLQTPKPLIENHKVLVPLLHWFNQKRKDSIPLLCLPDANVCFKTKVPPLNQLYYVAPGDLYIQETVNLLSAAGPYGSLVNPNVVIQRRTPFLVPGSVVQSSGQFLAHIVMCHIYLDDCVHAILLHRIGFHLIRVIRRSVVVVNTTDGEFDVNNVKWPVEYAFLRDIPYENIDESVPDTAENWWRCGHQRWEVDPKSFCCNTVPNDTVIIDQGGDPQYQTIYTKHVNQCHFEKIKVVEEAVTEFGLNIYDADFYEKQATTFYRNYLPFAYSNGYVVGDDVALPGMMFTIAQIPGYSNPNGHFNVSKTRNVKYNLTTVLGPKGKVALISDYTCINFIIISDGSLIIRYM